MTAVELHGYHYSVYTRIVRIALIEKGIAWQHFEIDPFAEEISDEYQQMHPFSRVPTLVHDGFVLYEAGAITRYLDEAFDGPSLQPADPAERARMTQVMSIVDSYGYWPMVRQVFSHGVFRPHEGEPWEQNQIRAGLDSSRLVLRALDGLTQGGGYLVGERLSLADIHLAPMMACFSMATEGVALLGDFEKLNGWWGNISERDSVASTDPGLPELG